MGLRSIDIGLLKNMKAKLPAIQAIARKQAFMQQINDNHIRIKSQQQLARNRKIYPYSPTTPQLNLGSDRDFRKKVFQQ